MEDARMLGERNWRNAARNRDSWQKLLRKALAQKVCCANDDDEEITHQTGVHLQKQIFNQPVQIVHHLL